MEILTIRNTCRLGSRAGLTVTFAFGLVSLGAAGCTSSDGDSRVLSSGGTDGGMTSVGSSDDSDDPMSTDDGLMRLDLPSDDGDSGDGGSCQELEFLATPLRPRIMLIMDQSQSMAGERWADLNMAVSTVLAKYGDAADLGARFFPPMLPLEECNETDVDVELGSMSAGTISNLIATNEPFGYTPMLPAVEASAAHLAATDDGRPGLQILVSDGEPSRCGTVAEVFDAIEAIYAGGPDTASVPTHVIGIGGFNSAQLDGFAWAGGTETAHDTNDLAELEATLDGIVKGAISCTLQLDPAPAYQDEVVIAVDGQPVSRLAGPADCGNGFFYTNPDFTEIQLCGAACDAIAVAGTATVTYSCPAG